jgi:hypothetical protein
LTSSGISSLRSRSGGDEEGNDVEAVEEVFAEVAARDLLFQVLVGGGDDAHVNVYRLGSAYGEKALLVQCAQHAGLRLQAHVAHLVQEERATVGAFEGAAFLRWRARPSGDGPPAVAEEFRLDVVLGDGGTIQLDEDAVLAQALRVHGAADQLLACAAFAIDQHAAVGGGHQLDLLAQRLHGHAIAGDAGAEAELAHELPVVLAEPACADRVLQHNQRAVQRERLFQEVVGAELGGAHRRFDGSVAADNDDFGQMRSVHLADVGERVQAVAVGQPDVEQDGVVAGRRRAG